MQRGTIQQPPNPPSVSSSRRSSTPWWRVREQAGCVGELCVHVCYKRRAERVDSHWEGAPLAGRINKPIKLNVAPALPNVPALHQQYRRQQHPLLIRWSFASEAASLVEWEGWRDGWAGIQPSNNGSREGERSFVDYHWAFVLFTFLSARISVRLSSRPTSTLIPCLSCVSTRLYKQWSRLTQSATMSQSTWCLFDHLSIVWSSRHPSLCRHALLSSLVRALICTLMHRNLNFRDGHWRFGLDFAQFGQRRSWGGGGSHFPPSLSVVCVSVIYLFSSGLLRSCCHSRQKQKLSISLRSLALPQAIRFSVGDLTSSHCPITLNVPVFTIRPVRQSLLPQSLLFWDNHCTHVQQADGCNVLFWNNPLRRVFGQINALPTILEVVAAWFITQIYSQTSNCN